MRSITILLFAFLFSCGNPVAKTSDEMQFEVLDFEPNVDSVWYHNIYRIEGNRLLGIAQPIDESRKGIRLQLFDLEEDSSITLIEESNGAFDSYVFLPTFFKKGNDVMMLVNTGYQDTWGNRIIKLKNETFVEMGFIDAGVPIRTVEPNEYDDLYYTFDNIAECAQFSEDGHEISFNCDSVVLFDDGEGNLNRIVGGNGIKYVLSKGKYSLETNFKESS